MATQVQFRGGTTTEHASFNGAAREVTVDTTKQTLVVQDGSTNGGFPLLREDGTQSLKTTGDISIDSDTSKLKIGDNEDLQISHDGSDNLIRNITGDLYIQVTATNERAIVAKADNAVQLHYDGGTAKFETTADGAKTTGQLLILDTSAAIGSEGNLKIQANAAGADIGGGITFGNSNARRAAIIGKQHSTDALAGYLAFGTRPSNADIQERLRITADGQIQQYGFTTAADGACDDLALGNTTDGVNRGMTLWSHSSQNGTIAFADEDSNFQGAIQYLHSADTLLLKTNNTVEGLRVTSGGEIGINGTTPSNGQMLAITGRSGYDDIVQVTAVGTDMGPRINLTPTNSGVSRINATANNLALQTGGTSRLSIGTTGDVTIEDGNLVVANGKGIMFYPHDETTTTNGSDSNLLDDYEEGTFEPGITFGGGNTDLVLGTALGSYTKIGRRVFIDFTINFSAKGTSTGNARITNLPFTSLNAVVIRSHGFCSYYANMFSLTGRPVLYNSQNLNSVLFYDDAASTQPGLNQANFADNSSIRGKIEYTCA